MQKRGTRCKIKTDISMMNWIAEDVTFVTYQKANTRFPSSKLFRQETPCRR